VVAIKNKYRMNQSGIYTCSYGAELWCSDYFTSKENDDKMKYHLPIDVEEVLAEDEKSLRRISRIPRLDFADIISDIYGSKMSQYSLIAPIAYGVLEDQPQQPFQVLVHPQVSLLCDIHSYLCTSEIIGLLAGKWDDEKKILFVQASFPCASTKQKGSGATDVELDPVAEYQARDIIDRLGLTAVGWYHSHPKFKPNPSKIDIANQSQYQQHMSNPFVALIVSTFDSATGSVETKQQWFFVANVNDPRCLAKKSIEVPMLLDVQVPTLKSNIDSDKMFTLPKEARDEFIEGLQSLLIQPSSTEFNREAFSVPLDSYTVATTDNCIEISQVEASSSTLVDAVPVLNVVKSIHESNIEDNSSDVQKVKSDYEDCITSSADIYLEKEEESSSTRKEKVIFELMCELCAHDNPCTCSEHCGADFQEMTELTNFDEKTYDTDFKNCSESNPDNILTVEQEFIKIREEAAQTLRGGDDGFSNCRQKRIKKQREFYDDAKFEKLKKKQRDDKRQADMNLDNGKGESLSVSNQLAHDDIQQKFNATRSRNKNSEEFEKQQSLLQFLIDQNSECSELGRDLILNCRPTTCCLHLNILSMLIYYQHNDRRVKLDKKWKKSVSSMEIIKSVLKHRISFFSFDPTEEKEFIDSITILLKCLWSEDNK
jgi:proteasome lid subunit RPN8/RPN11